MMEAKPGVDEMEAEPAAAREAEPVVLVAMGVAVMVVAERKVVVGAKLVAAREVEGDRAREGVEQVAKLEGTVAPEAVMDFVARAAAWGIVCKRCKPVGTECGLLEVRSPPLSTSS